MRALADCCDLDNIDIIASSKEKYSQISTPKFVFRDSFSHLSSSLDSLVKNLLDKGEDQFTLLRQGFPEIEQFKACLRKLVYPYSYMTSFDKFDEPIPDPEHFYNDLNDEDIEEIEYERLLSTCKLFGITTLGELHDLYLKIDVLLLACVFESYRQMGLSEYGLDPAYYLSAPSFSFDAMLFQSGVELELLEDPAMYKFFEDVEKEEDARFARYCHQLESQYDMDMDYEGHWGDIDADFVGDISEEILEELK